LNTSKEELRKLLAHVEASHEAEKGRFARILHDDLSQKLTALLIELSLLETAFAPNTKEASKMADLSGMVSSISQSVRGLTNELRLKILDEFGLFPALKHETQRLSKESKVRLVLLPQSVELDLAPELGAELFKVFQNIASKMIVRHGATEIEVLTSGTARSCLLRVSENGKGQRGKKLFESGSVELLDLHERARRFGGTIELAQVRGQGTIVTIKVKPKKR